jgi:MFS family permease
MAASTWPASAFSLVAGSFFLVAGRLADMYGGYYCFLGGLAWSAVWSIGAGFSQNNITADIFRAIQGFGLAFSLPASIMLVSQIYRPGPRKNLVFSMYGGCAPVGYAYVIYILSIKAIRP